ncbi:hypothetical protein AMS68_003631 [Peltaster fructicola]|uniref:3-beta hydroxysteroid dehydrogenase/isomerase domain-containing protein n=1 Tax=Peltaster fructicola TaxID=286661 RepID=A0A6H0XTQ2_9PEZI|nr:hypothetical protein AMS68_003631 [Peltaster fructicola]
MATTKQLGHVLVTGGAGLLGNNIVKLLRDRKVCSKLTVLDIKKPRDPFTDVDYKIADITDYDSLLALFKTLNVDAVIHTASPPSFLHSDAIFYKVNVEGTQSMVRASQETGVKAFVYTSSASVIHDTISDLINADETYPLIMGKDQPQYYSTTKAEAELYVLAANRTQAHPSFLTAAIRPSAMFGEGDIQACPPICTAYYQGQAKFQLGSNENLFDWTEISNVAHAHHLAVAALTITYERIKNGQPAPLDHEKVDGEAFIITNDTPTYFWDFPRSLWRELGHKGRAGETGDTPRHYNHVSHRTGVDLLVDPERTQLDTTACDIYLLHSILQHLKGKDEAWL